MLWELGIYTRKQYDHTPALQTWLSADGCVHQKFQERGQFAVSQLGLSAGGRQHHVISLQFLSLLQGKWKTMTTPAPDLLLVLD